MSVLFSALLLLAEEIIQLQNGHMISLSQLANNRIKIAPLNKANSIPKYSSREKTQQSVSKTHNILSLIARLRDNPEDLSIWQSLSKLENSEITELCKISFDEDENLAKRIISYAAKKKLDTITSILMDKLRSDSCYHKYLALYGLTSVGSKNILPDVRGLLKSEDFRLQQLSIEYLSRHLDHVSIQDIFYLLKDQNLSDNAADALQYFFKNGYEDKIFAYAHNYFDQKEYIPTLLKLVGKLKIYRLGDKVIGLLQTKDKTIKQIAIETAAKLGTTGISDEINKILENEADLEIVKCAIDSSKWLKDHNNNFRLLEKLNDRNYDIQILAAQALRQKTGLNLPTKYEDWAKVIKK